LINRCAILPMHEQDFIKDRALAVRDGRIVFSGPSKLAADLKGELDVDTVVVVGKILMKNGHFVSLDE